MKRNQYLPMGTVVQLNDQDNKVMICGRQQIVLKQMKHTIISDVNIPMD